MKIVSWLRRYKVRATIQIVAELAALLAMLVLCGLIYGYVFLTLMINNIGVLP